MLLVKKFYSPDDQAGGGTETAEEKATRLEAELVAERAKVTNQNSYITKLEAERNKPQTTQPKPAVTPQPAVQPAAQAQGRDPYLVELQTKDVINNGLEKVKALVGEVVFAEIKDDATLIARANIKNPSNVSADLFERVAEMALGRAMKDETKRVKIAGAYVNAPAPAAQPVVQPVVVTNPNDKKLGTMTPEDKQGLGNQPTPGQQQTPTKRTPKDFLRDLRNGQN